MNMKFLDQLNELSDPINNADLKNENLVKKRTDSVDKLIDQLHDDSFEWFIHEWCFGFMKEQYNGGIFRIGGAGDKGRDIACFLNDRTQANYEWDNYQCKYYKDPLAPSDIWKDVGKIIYYSYTNVYPRPRSYYFLAKKDVGSTLLDYLKDNDTFKKELKSNWEKHCKDKITTTKKIELDSNLEKYIDSFDFSIFKTKPILQIFEEHSKTRYHYMRFGAIDKIPRPNPAIPEDEVKSDEENLPYIKDLLAVYSEDTRIEIKTVDELKKFDQSFENFKRQRISFYFAEQLRAFGKENYPPEADYSDLMTQIYDGIIETHEADYSNSSERLSKVLAQASLVPINPDHILSGCIKSNDKKGICHQLTNIGRIRWIKKVLG